MCLKTNLVCQNNNLEQDVIQQAKEIINLLENGRQKEQLLKYEIVRQQGYYNMFDPQARKLTGLSEKEYINIQNHYSELMQKYPNVKEQARKNLGYMKSATIAKVIALNGCKKCKRIVSNKLDVTLKDLCENCRKITKPYIAQ